MGLIDADKYPCSNCNVKFCRHNECGRYSRWFCSKVDAAPVVHASWMIHYYDMSTYSYKYVTYNESSFNNPEGIMFCSHCDKEALCNGVEEYTPSRYCPHCGARMGGDPHGSGQ